MTTAILLPGHRAPGYTHSPSIEIIRRVSAQELADPRHPLGSLADCYIVRSHCGAIGYAHESSFTITP